MMSSFVQQVSQQDCLLSKKDTVVVVTQWLAGAKE
jgi:hypothetical protein